MAIICLILSIGCHSVLQNGDGDALSPVRRSPADLILSWKEYLGDGWHQAHMRSFHNKQSG